ncbi:peroxiredoxin [Candidatus Endobugula sertula]|uniref:thioredoxin-dependent peroxiredoxin n=1 Tax=Candidatus Endobugula sertula TaxID=62101 RepID=A0A1D2QSF3_9GAMM|nr:peroxiredoxin [Candidatus Endobugula sertula]
MAFPKIGNKAPAFSLKNQHGDTVALKDFAGKKNVVIYFYPKALTPGCTTQACGLHDIQKELKDRDTVVFGLSPDPIARLQKFIDKHELNFDLLSDENHTVADKYGAWGLKKFMGKEFMGILRTTFVINKELRLVGVMDKFKTKDHHQELIFFLDTIF